MWIFAFDVEEGEAEELLGSEDLLPHEARESMTAKEAGSLLEGLDFDEEDEAPKGDDDEPAEPEDDEPSEDEEEVDEEEDDLEEDDEEESDEEDDPEDEDEDDEVEEPDVYTVKVDGEDVEVTLEELTSGYSRTADYTRKTTALAGERAEANAARDQYGQRLEILNAAIVALGPREVDWDKAKAELPPEEFAALWADHQRAKEQRAGVEKEQLRVRDEQIAESNQAMETHLDEERTKLRTAMPGWDDEDVATEEAKKLVSFATVTYGFVDQDFSNLVDHRLLVMLNDAMQWREQQKSGKEKIRKKVKAAPKVVPTGRKKTSPKGRRKSKTTEKRLRGELVKTGRSEDAAALIEHLMDD